LKNTTLAGLAESIEKQLTIKEDIKLIEVTLKQVGEFLIIDFG